MILNVVHLTQTSSLCGALRTQFPRYTSGMPSAAHLLTGLSVAGGWKVLGPAPPELEASGGIFSKTYLVESLDGSRRGLLKALDYSRAFETDDPAILLEPITRAFNIERELLRRCQGLDHVVTAIGDGTARVEGTQHPVVQFLIFDLPDGDGRRYANAARKLSLASRLRALHGAAVGLDQLHRQGIAHQNLRPSDVFDYGPRTKVANLSRAVASGESPVKVANDEQLNGDPSYAPPEILYGHNEPDWRRRSFGADLYMLGSLVVFFFTGVSTSVLLRTELREDHVWLNWTASFAEVLPYVRHAFERVLVRLADSFDPEAATALTLIVQELCEPDPPLRGHPMNRGLLKDQYSLERYISSFDSLSRRAEISYWKAG